MCWGEAWWKLVEIYLNVLKYKHILDDLMLFLCEGYSLQSKASLTGSTGFLFSMHTWSKTCFSPILESLSNTSALAALHGSKSTRSFLPKKATRSKVNSPIPNFRGDRNELHWSHWEGIRVFLYAASLFIPTQILTLCVQSVEETLLWYPSIIGNTPPLSQDENKPAV